MKLLFSIFLVSFASITNLFSQDCSTLCDEVVTLIKANNFKEALLKGEESCKFCQKSGGEDYAYAMNNLAFIYTKLKNFKKAEPLYLKVYQIMEKELGPDNVELLSKLNNLSIIYIEEIKEYRLAIPILLKMLELQKKHFGIEQADYANTLNKLGFCYMNLLEFNNALPYYNQTIEIHKNILGEENSDYALSLQNLGVLLEQMGDYEKAEMLFIKSLEVIKKNLGEESEEFGNLIDNLGSLYHLLGDNKKTEPLFLQALSIHKNLLGEEHPNYIKSLHNLSSLYLEMKDYKKAEPLILQLLININKISGVNNLDYVNALNTASSLYYNLGDFKKAEQMDLQALNLLKKVVGEENIEYARISHNLGLVYSQIGDYKNAELFGINAITIGKKVLHEEHPDFINYLNGLANLYMKNGDYIKAETFFLKAFNSTRNNMQNAMAFLSSTQSDNYILNNIDKYQNLYSYLISNPNSSIKDSLLNFNYFIKGALLQNNSRLTSFANSTKDRSVNTIWANYKEIKNKISKLYQLPIESKSNVAQEEEKAEKLEKLLMQKLPEFQIHTKNNKIRWQQIQEALNEKEATVEFVNFNFINNKNYLTDTTYYGAFIIKKGLRDPIFINCFQEKDLKVILDKSNSAKGINSIYRGFKPTVNTESNNYELYNLIWKPIEQELQDIDKVYISPTGLLNNVAFSAIETNSNKKLFQKYTLHMMSNTRALTEFKKSVTKPNTMVILGGIDYDNQPNIKSKSSEVKDSEKINAYQNESITKWPFLEGTKTEVDQLKIEIDKLKSIKSEKFTGSNASEELIKEMGNGNIDVPNILHIATHGFVFPISSKENSDKLTFNKSDDALTRAGLILAGANKMWTTGSPFTNKEDGILTAREITDLELSNCNLAVLSACETGLGEIKGNEGVFGLQRAFKIAGVHNLIISLWQVPDAETSEFMQLFYKNWLQNETEIHSAFRQTQQIMSAKYEAYQWAAFVLME